jgi:hypothetical protein
MDQSCFNDYEIKLIRFFAQRFQEHKDEVERTEVPGRCNEPVGDDHESSVSIKRLAEYGLIKIVTHGKFKALPGVYEIVQKWDNPPLPDRPAEIKKWFFSKWWSIPIMGIFVVLPALVGYITTLKTILKWCAITK